MQQAYQKRSSSHATLLFDKKSKNDTRHARAHAMNDEIEGVYGQKRLKMAIDRHEDIIKARKTKADDIRDQGLIKKAKNEPIFAQWQSNYDEVKKSMSVNAMKKTKENKIRGFKSTE